MLADEKTINARSTTVFKGLQRLSKILLWGTPLVNLIYGIGMFLLKGISTAMIQKSIINGFGMLLLIGLLFFPFCYLGLIVTSASPNSTAVALLVNYVGAYFYSHIIDWYLKRFNPESRF